MDTNFLTKVADVFVILAEFFIEAHKMGVEMIMEAKDQISYDLGGGIIWMLLGVILIVLLLVVDLFIIYVIYSLLCWISIWIRTKEIKRNPVIGKVIGKEYEEEDTTYMYNDCLHIMTPIINEEEYNISVRYGELEETFDDENLFNQYEKGDPISLILVQRIDRKGDVIKETLESPE